jgi:penicillin-binding protein 1C
MNSDETMPVGADRVVDQPQLAPGLEGAVPPPLTPPHKGEGSVNAGESPSPLWGGVRGGGSSISECGRGSSAETDRDWHPATVAIKRLLARPVGMIRRLALATLATLAIAATAALTLDRLDRAYPPPLDRATDFSVEVVDRHGALLRAYATADGTWRLPVATAGVDPQFLRMLVAYEDKRFHEHRGVDPLAAARAAWQVVAHGRIVSGGSTITMQLARLIEPREARSLGAKLRQALRALQIERRLSKDEILTRYLTLAPYGGNIEGVRAASLAWFGKEPGRLTLPEAALLVALPQSPEARRPDRRPQAARAARDRVLARMADAGVIAPGEVARAAAETVSSTRRPLPGLAAHAADAAVAREPRAQRHALSIDRFAQAALEEVARAAAERLGPKVSVAMVMADAQTGAVLARVGSASAFDHRRGGWIDMAAAQRSPGSTLKPFIYGLAMEDGIVRQETLIEDRPADFSGYRPKNFDMDYQGDVSVRQALQLSLNVPAIRLLEAVGPMRLVARMKQGGVTPALPKGETPGLAIGLGGAGVTLEGLVQLYTGLANGGRAATLTLSPDATVQRAGQRILSPQAVWQVADMLSGVVPPQGAPRLGIAYKTGTSYGYRDAWSVGYDGRHVLGVWVGRPDGGSVPGLTGYRAAAPILFEGFAKSGLGIAPLPRPPAGALRLAAAELPFALRRFAPTAAKAPAGATEPAPRIVYPPAGARVDLGLLAEGRPAPLALKLNGGRAPFRWLANGRPADIPGRRRTTAWTPQGAGFQTLTVIDAAGRAASVKVFVE